MQELLTGVQLRTVDPAPLRTAEARLSSHDLLLREIKARSVVLKPPAITSQTEKGARDVMMDYIKSRPRLRPVGERKMPRTPVKDETPVEKLLSDLRGDKARQSLRRARVRVNTSDLVDCVERVVAREGKRGKKILEPEQDFQSSAYNFEESPNSSFDEDSVFSEAEKQGRGHTEADGPLGQQELTLEELSTIRLKLTKANLEMADVSHEKRLALDKGKICFNCEKIKFNFYTWPHHCNICKRSVCKSKGS